MKDMRTFCTFVTSYMLGFAFCLPIGVGGQAVAADLQPPAASLALPLASPSAADILPSVSPTDSGLTDDQRQAVKEALIEPIELKTSLIKTQEYPVDLATVLKLIADQNLLIAESKKNTEIFQSRLRQNQVALLPDISGVYTQSQLTGAQQIFGGDVVTVVRKTVQPQLVATWTIYPGGRTIYQILAAKRRKTESDFNLKQTYQEQLSTAAQNYYRLLAAYIQKGVVIRGIEEAREQVMLNQAKAKVGTGIPLDLSQAKTKYAQQETALVQAETLIILAEQTLLNELNLDPTIHLVPSEADALKKPLIPAALPFPQLLTDAVRLNPSLKVTDEELKALGFDYKTVRSDLIPSITLRSYVNKTGPDWDTLARTDFRGLTVNVDLLKNLGLQIPFQMQERKKLIEEKMLERQALLRSIQTDVTTAYLNSQNFESAIASSEQELASANESYTLAVGRFKAGYGLNLDVLSAQVALATARSNLVQAILNYNQAQVRLLQGLGLVSPEALVLGLH
jgi:outer membrane protein TolC